MKKLSPFQQKVIDFLKKKNCAVNSITHSIGKSTVKSLGNLIKVNFNGTIELK